MKFRRNDMLPTRDEAERLLEEANQMNPGPWGDHSRVVACCAERIARACSGMDPDKAYVLGLLHDIGRREGVTSMRHVTDGYHFLKRLGYGEAARVCVTHSFAVKNIRFYIGAIDVPEAEYREIEELLAGYEYDDYDRLIQLCDSLAMADGTIDLKKRMDDVERRHGYFPEEKRQAHYHLKETFDEKAGMDLYQVLRV
jgi:putative nucleotidyltransferase with HDIG domain